MKVTNVRIDGALGRSSLGFEVGPVTALTGPTGSGKTATLLLLSRARELIAPSAPERPPISPFGRPESPGVRVILGLGFDAQERTRFGVSEREEVEVIQPRGAPPTTDASPGAAAALGHHDHRGEQGFFELVPAERTGVYSFQDMGEAHQKRLRSLESASKYAWIESFFADVALGVSIAGRPAADILDVNGAFDAMACPLRLDHARRVGATHAPVFSLGGSFAVGLADLPSGCRQAAVFVALVTHLRPRRCVLLIDDLERDLDAEMQLGALDLLRRGDNQVLFSTRSAALARSSAVTRVVELDRPAA